MDIDRRFDLGFLGGGQLARMSIQAAQRMGLTCISLDPAIDSPAYQIARSHRGQLNDPEAVAQIFKEATHVTLENEFIPADVILDALAASKRDASALVPGAETLRTIQDKFTQRQAYAKHRAPSPMAVELDPNNPGAAIVAIGLPCVLKARFGGYDGKGTRYARTDEEFDSHRDLWSQGGWMVEQFVPFKREVAVMVCRSKTQTVCFPTMETIQSNHVCDLVFPADTDASQAAIAAVEAVDGYGLFGVELFELQNGSFQINEIAPRPHNTGHYTLDWGGLSQFDAHVRLCLGLPIPELTGQPTCMANLLGQEGAKDYKKALEATVKAHPEARVHWYGKAESRPGRKMGHLNVSCTDCRFKAEAARQTFYDVWTNQ